ncbi:class I SAM-dependent methyltransferase [Micavibrio aeruginosavorus]|uniref:class I SAM-dependent methyltransferase n=1 Tax=Micavibrio aeruginosavorus TaxID=349221 RepID=UPI003F4A9107
MSKKKFTQDVLAILESPERFVKDQNFSSFSSQSEFVNQNSTNEAFSKKWLGYNDSGEKEKWFSMQKKWYLDLYGFSSEWEFADFLSTKKYIYDAGCGMGYKAAWFAELSPNSIVVGIDFSETAKLAAETYKGIDNLFFLQADIAERIFKEGSIDYVSCDQVIMHTENPEKTFAELSRVTKPDGQFSCYFYAKKALPRELVDDFFRNHCANMTHDSLMEMSEQLTELGKRLSALNVSFDAPAIPALGIKGGEIDIQRFVYWNFLKCYWNEDMGQDTSVITNYDWYSPSNARRFSKEEVQNLVSTNKLHTLSFHEEEACYSGRFSKVA